MPAPLHLLLTAALDAIPEAERAVGPWRSSGAKVSLGSIGFLGIALELVSRVRPLVKRKDRASFERYEQVARRVYDRHQRGETGRGRTRKFPAKFYGLNRVGAAHTWSLQRDEMLALRELVSTPRYEYVFHPEFGPALAIAHAAALQAYYVEAPISEVAHVRHALLTTIDLLKGTRGALRTLVNDLDQWLLREELRTTLKSHPAIRQRVTACLWRALSAPVASIGALEPGEFVLVHKPRTRFELLTGPLDEVLASVPDVHLRQAMLATKS